MGEEPHLVNEAAMTDGWFIKLTMSNPEEVKALMNEKTYADHCETEHD